MDDRSVLAAGVVERIGEEKGQIKHENKLETDIETENPYENKAGAEHEHEQ